MSTAGVPGIIDSLHARCSIGVSLVGKRRGEARDCYLVFGDKIHKRSLPEWYNELYERLSANNSTVIK